jgi:WD40 repeat protein
LANARTLRAEAPISDFSLSPSGSEMAATLRDGSIRVWTLAGERRAAWAPGEPPTPWLLYLGERRILAGGPGFISVLDAATGARSVSWTVPELTGAAAAPDGSLLAGAGADGRVWLWKPDGTLLRTLEAAGLVEITRLAVAPGARRIAVGATDADLRLFDAATGRVERTIDLTMAPFALDFSADGRTLAAGCADGTVTLWDASSGRLKATLGRYPLGVGAIRVSPDGKRVASASVSSNPSTAEAEARLCDLAAPRETSTPIGVSTWNAVGFAPDGRAFVAVIRGETVTLTDLAS